MVFWRKQKEMPEETVEEIIEEPPAPPPAEEEPSKWVTIVKLVCIILLHILFISYFIWCTVVFIRFDKEAHCAAAANTSVNTTQELDPFVILCSYNWCIGYGFLIILCVLVYGFVIYFMLFKPYVGAKLYDKSVEPIVGKWMKFSRQKLVSIILLVLVLVVVFGFIFYTTRHNIKKARGIAAPIFFILMGYIFSKHRKAIPWRIVVHGLLLQFIIGVIILRWKHGYRIIFCVGDKLVTLLKFTSNGARFVYGDQINDEFVFAFTITAIIFFFSVLTSCLYYLGLIPRMLRAFGGVLQSIVGTTVCESVLAVTNVFLSMSESPLIILPYLERLTNSELHCICVSGYATIAGSVLGAYISIGATPAYLIAASVMAAPASLGYSKLFYPETEESLTKSENIKMEASRETSLLDAALSGAFNAISIVLGIVSNAIAFISVVALINSIVQWIFMLAGDDDTTFIELLGKALMPLAFLMGVPWHDCAEVGQVFAMKIVINAFVGYKKLAQLIKDDHLDNQSDAIATFAICGFSNIISMSITIASLTALAPSRRADIAHVAFRAIFVGIIVSYTSASYAAHSTMDPETTDDFKEEEKPESRLKNILKLIFFILLHLFFFGYFIWCSVVYFRYDKSSSKCKDKSEFNASGDVPANETANATASVFQPHILCSINWCTGYGFLIIFFIVFYILWLYYNIFKPYVGQRIYDAAIEPVSNQWMVFSRRNLVSITMLLCAIAIVIAILAYESRRDASKLVGIAGPVAFIAIGYVFSRNRSAIPWRIVVHGILGQFLLGIVCLNFNLGRSILNCVSNKVVTMLSFTSFGIKFAYGERIYNELLFAFGVLSVFFYLSVITSCLYYLGVMQKMLRLFGWWLQVLIGTTACENFNAVGNIFLSMSESLLLIQPYIDRLTKSELHAICVSGYATVSSTMMGAYVLHGASPAYLLTASVMAVPGSLAFSKLLYPETEESLTKSENIQQEESKETSLLDAASSGAARSIMIVLAIVSTIIAFISIVACFNAIVEWTFLLAGVPNINLIWILTQVALPFVFFMGVPLEDCQKIANIVAEKTIINEFVAFIKLGKLIKNDEVNAHSAAIATFATCAFANPGSLAILVAALCVMAPTRRTDIVKVSLRAFLTSSIVSFTSASFAGILINPGEFDKMAYSFFEVEDNRNAELWFNAE